MKKNTRDRKKLARELGHPTVPPRLEGVVRNAKIKLLRKKKKRSDNDKGAQSLNIQ